MRSLRFDFVLDMRVVPEWVGYPLQEGKWGFMRWINVLSVVGIYQHQLVLNLSEDLRLQGGSHVSWVHG